MRRFTMVQDIALDLEEHWRLFLDDDFDKAMYLEGFGFPRYELLEHRDGDGESFRRIRVVPKLDVPGPVAKLLGSSFAYTEEQTFDKKARTLRARVIPSVLADRLGSTSAVRAESTASGKTRRNVEVTVEARIFGIGTVVEGALEKNLRTGWEKAAAYMNKHAARKG
jgi:Protein of unknown function (DUF2505)